MADERPAEPAAVGLALGDAAALPTITFAGKRWTVGAPTGRAKSALEELVVEIATANVERLQKVLSPAKYAAKVKELDKQIDGGHYVTWGELWRTVSDGPDGRPAFLCALLRERHPDGEATMDVARQMWLRETRQVRRALARVVPTFFDLLLQYLPAEEEEREVLRRGLAAEWSEPSLASDSNPHPPTA